MKVNLIIKAIIIILLVLFGCKKVTDEVDPSITIESPAEDAVFNIPDTIFIRAVVKDDNQIESIQIVVTDESFSPAFGAFSYPSDNNPVIIEDILVVDDVLIPGGVYYLRIKAFDGENSKNAFRKIYINEVPRELLDVILITKDAGSLAVEKIENDFSLGTLFNVDGAFEQSEINSRSQLLYIAGKYYDNLKAYNLDNKQLEWFIEGKNYPPLPYFRSLHYQDELLYVSISEGEIRAYNESLVKVVTAKLQPNRIPGPCLVLGNYIIASVKEISGTHSYLESYYAISGSYFDGKTIDMDIIGLFRKDQDEIYVIANSANDAVLFVYDIQNNELDEIRTFGGKHLLATTQIDENNIILAFGDGVYLYSYNFNSLTTFVGNIEAVCLEYDELGNMLYVAELRRISAYRYPQATFLNEIDVSKDVLNIHLHYNK